MVKKAREEGSGLVALSSEAPHFHGASVNEKAETICFSHMKRILRIDREARYARVEPGVTFGELIPAMKAEGLRLNLPFLARAGKSVTASALEREGVLIPKYQYDYPDPLLTVETVFGTGDVFATGSAAGPGSYEENGGDMILPWGPGSIDYLRFLAGSQGTIGLVTWATLKAEVVPTSSRLFFIEAERGEELTALANTLCRKRIPDECVILNRENFAAAFGNDCEEEQALQGAAPWLMLCRVCGFDRYPEERLAIYSEYVVEECEKASLRALREFSLLPGLESRVEAMLTDCDRREDSWKLRLGEESELLFLAPPSKAAGLLTLLEQRLPGAGLTVQPQVQGRALRIEVNLRHAGGCGPREEDWQALARELKQAGAYFDRPYGRLTELVYEDPLSVEGMRRIKQIFDPDNVLNPGKLCF